MVLNRFLKAVLAVSLLFVAPSCATSTAGDLPCEGDEDCPVGTACDTEQQQCVRVAFDTNSDGNARPSPPDREPENSQTNDVLNNISRDMGDDEEPDSDQRSDASPETDMAEPTCEPACDDNQVCDRGTCVSACEPECEAPAVCTANGCEIPDCSEVGDPCDLDNPDQGEFTCLDADGEGLCVASCDNPFTAGDCPSGEYCWTLQDHDVCIPATCDDHSDCTEGSCVDFDNDFAICFQAGSLSEGASCDPDDSQCEEGTFCRETGPGTGVCSRLCDEWSADPGCPFDEYCAERLTPRTALCTDEVDVSAPNDAFFICGTAGFACNDGVRCFDLGNDNVCMQYCRTGEDDCAGITDGGGSDTICNNYAFGGERALGICWPPCDPTAANPCGEGVCVDQICRTTCTVGNAAADCCDGNPSCPFECNPDTNLCE